VRLKSFTAASMAEAMTEIRAVFGADAVIVSSQRINGGAGVRVTAAVENDDDLAAADGPLDQAPLDQPPNAQGPLDRGPLETALAYHEVPAEIVARLRAALPTAGMNGAEPEALLAGAIDACFDFQPLPVGGAPTPIALVGPPGAGKTVTVAKLAARAVMAGAPVRLISTDSFRAGGVEQLAAFTGILGVELSTAGSPRELQRVLAEGDPRTMTVIDTAGVNPFAMADVVRLAELVIGAAAAPVLTLPAGGNAADAREIGAVFADLGATRLLVTRVDVARRFGAVLAAAEGGNLAFSDISISPHVSRGLEPLNASDLARLVLREPDADPFTFPSNEATP